MDDKGCSHVARRTDPMQSKERLQWERDCVERVLSGDQRAFADLYREYAPRIFSRVLIPRLGNRTAAEDALSETFRTGMERLGQFQPKGVSIYYWFSRIAVNKATDMHRVKARTQRALTSFQGLLEPLRGEKAEAPGDALAAEQEQAILTERIATIMDSINPRYARAIELRFLEDRSRQDCAEAMDVKLGTFDVLILRALRAFRKEWDKLGGGS